MGRARQFSVRGKRRALIVFLTFAVTLGVFGPALGEVLSEQLAQLAAEKEPGHGPGQRWGTASADGERGPGNQAKAATVQSKYPAIQINAKPQPAGNDAKIKEIGNDVKGFDAATSKELAAERGERSRTFRNADGTLTSEYAKDPLNFKNGKGDWQPIDTNLVSDNGFRNSADSVTTRFAPKADAQTLAKLELDKDHRVEFGLSDAAPAAGTTIGNTVTYQGIRPHADVRFEVEAGGFKEFLVLHNPEAPHVWRFPLRLTGLTAELKDGDVVLRDKDKAERAVIPSGYMADSKKGEISGITAESRGVKYELLSQNGQQVLQVSLDSAWLRDPARVYPVVVDPPVHRKDATQSMFVQKNGDGSNWSQAGGELRAGHVVDGGSFTAASYIDFPNIENDLRNHRILGTQLAITNYHSTSCRPFPITVHAVTQGWTASNQHRFPGPGYDGNALGSAEFAHGWIAPRTTVSKCPTATELVPLGDAGRALVQRWVNHEQANFGLTVRASETDGRSWKKFTGAGTANPPRLAITHSPYDAGYKWENPVPEPAVLSNRDGNVKLTVTNRSAMDWGSNDFALGYRKFGANGEYLGWAESATLPGTLARGASVTLTAKIHQAPAATYGFEFSMLRRGGAWFTDEQVAPAGLTLRIENLAPAVQEQWPPNGHSSPTLRPAFWARAIDLDAPPGSALKYRFQICDKNEANCFDSGKVAGQTWTVPSGKLLWSTDYKWRVYAYDALDKESIALGFSTLLTAVPQPDITAHLGTAPYSGAGGDFAPQVGNYTTGAVDASVTTVGPELTLNRTYNSLDPRRDSLFGAGWSSRYDMKITPDADGSGNVVMTYPDGQQVRFGANLDANGNPTGGRLAPPPGRWATLVPQPDGGWTLTDKANTFHVFNPDGKLREIRDAAGRWVELVYDQGKLKTATNKTSNRKLTFTWVGNHVATVSSDPVNGKTATWKYTYDTANNNPDRLISVCDPLTNCTKYDYQQGSHFRSAVIDSKPDGYWRFGEPQGADARSEIAINVGKDTGRYTDVTRTGEGEGVAGAGDRAALFNGSTSLVTLPRGELRKSRENSIELWFKTSGDGPLVGGQDTPFGTTPKSATMPLLYVGTDGKLRGQFWHGSINMMTSTAAVNDNAWHHVVLTSTVAKQWLYLDGVQVGTMDGQVDTFGLEYLQVGATQAFAATDWPAWGANARRHFNGLIDEVAVYVHTLGTPSIKTHVAARNAADQLKKVTLPSGKIAAEVTYDPQRDRMRTLVDRNGGKWTLSEPIVTGSDNNLVRSVRVIDPGNRAHFYDYDPLRGRILRYLSPLGMSTRPEDRPTPTTTPTTTTTTCVSQPGGSFCEVPVGGGPGSFVPVDMQGARSYEYNDAGFQSTITDENGNQVKLVHDKRGNITSRTSCRAAANCQTSYYEFFTNESNLTDPRLDKVIASRDARSANATDNTYKTSYTYTTLGELDTQTTPDGAVVKHLYTTGDELAFGGGTTPAGLVTESTDARLAKTKFRYYATGDLAEVTTPTGLVTTYSYDALGRKERTTQNGTFTATTYDQLSRVDSVTQPVVKNPVTNVSHQLKVKTDYTVDGFPQRVEASDLTGGDPTRVTTTEYDDRNRAKRLVDAEGRETSFGFDSFGNRTWMVGANGVKYEYAYTARNMVSEVRLRGWRDQWTPSEPDEEEDPVSANDHLVVAAFTYDLAGELVEQADAMGRKTAYRYYTDGLLKQTYAKGFQNEDGTKRDITLADFTYDAAGNVTKVVSTGNQVTTTEYDRVGRITATTADPDGLKRRTALTYDPNGNVKTVVRTGVESNTGSQFTAGESETVEYGYDTAGRQTSEAVKSTAGG